MVKIYGIRNCDTMKKASKWLDDKNITYDFYDYKKLGVDQDVLSKAIEQHSWENVINKRGTTWRNLSEDVQDNMNDKTALNVAMQNPSIIKRPLLVHKGEIHLGFKPDIYSKILGK